MLSKKKCLFISVVICIAMLITCGLMMFIENNSSSHTELVGLNATG